MYFVLSALVAVTAAAAGVVVPAPEGCADTWAMADARTKGNLTAVAYGAGTFVAVGGSGTIRTSVDGQRWVARSSPGREDLLAVCYGADRFVATGRSGTALTSANGSSWKAGAPTRAGDLVAVAYGAGTFVALDGHGAVLTSADGSHWIRRLLPSEERPLALTFGVDRFVAVGRYGMAFSSQDGRSWRPGRSAVGTVLFAVTFGAGRFLAVGARQVVATSVDGLTWQLLGAAPTGTLFGVTFGGGTFVAVDGGGGVLTSPDGTRWARSGLVKDRFADAVAFGGGQFVAVGRGGLIGYARCGRIEPLQAAFSFNPTSPTVGERVEFRDESRGEPTSWEWSFPDGGTSVSQHPSHTFESPGPSRVALTVRGEGGWSRESHDVTVTPPLAFSVWVPVASHAFGLLASRWRSDLELGNRNARPAHVELRLYGGGRVLTTTETVDGGGSKKISDVVGRLGYEGSGPMEVRSDQEIQVLSRTAHQGVSGSLAQEFPTYAVADGLKAGDVAWLRSLSETTTTRTDIGVSNIGDEPALVTVTLFDRLGAQVTSYTVALATRQWRQENRPYWTRGRRIDIESGFARILVNSGSGVIAYGSVIDNVSNQPSTAVMER
jgi:PKD repeat protein